MTITIDVNFPYINFCIHILRLILYLRIINFSKIEIRGLFEARIEQI